MLRFSVTVGRLGPVSASVLPVSLLVSFLVSLLALAGAGCADEVVYTSDPYWQDDTVRPSIGEGKILVTNSGSDSISWIDLATLEVVYTQPVGRLAAEREGPHHAAVSPDGSSIYVGISNFVPGGGTGPHGSHGTGDVPGWMLRYDTYSHELIGQSLVENNPGDVRTTPDGRLVLQSHFDLGKITDYLAGGEDAPDTPNSSLAIINARQMGEPTLVEVRSEDDECGAGHGIAVSADSRFAYVACNSGDVIARVGLSAPYPVTTTKVGLAPGTLTSPAYEPYAVAISPVDGTLWVSSTKSQDIRVIDPDAEPDADGLQQVGAPIPVVNGTPFFGDFTSDGATFIVAVQGQGTLEYIDTATRTRVSQQLPDGPDGACTTPHAVLVLPGDETALVVCEGNHQDPGTVAVVNIATRAVDAFFEVGVYPDDLVLLLP